MLEHRTEKCIHGFRKIRCVSKQPEPHFAFAGTRAALAIGRLALASMLALIPLAALADEVEELSNHLGKALGAFEAVEIFRQRCDERDPDGMAARRDALAAWSYDNERADYQRIMDGLLAQLSDLAPQIETQRAVLAERVIADLDGAPEQCGDFATLLENEQFDVRHDVRRILSLSRDLGIAIPPEPEIVPAVKSAEEIEILRLATLSSRLRTKMAEIGSHEGARNSSSLRKAREEHAEAWLKADGIQVLFGRVTAEDELREWRDDLQSAFEVDCRSFSEDPHEERMASSIGQDMVVVGMPRLVIDSLGGGRISLDRCSLFTLEEVDRPFVEEDDTAGLMLRPLEFAEAYAGPGQGIDLRDVERVLYDASFDNRIDGFGNGYIDRQEAIYVLLRDGTAYRHDWSFPFTDLDLDLSRHREPDRWFRWSEEQGTVQLAGADGSNALDLSGAQQLQPFAADTIEADYYYLQIGMGGARQDRRYVFAADGTLTYRRGGFVAGNVATGYIIVNGADDPEVEARYRFEDYALIIETADGEERHFLAQPVSSDPSLPDTLLIDGTAYWLDDE